MAVEWEDSYLDQISPSSFKTYTIPFVSTIGYYTVYLPLYSKRPSNSAIFPCVG